jgi:hypothetical protein
MSDLSVRMRSFPAMATGEAMTFSSSAWVVRSARPVSVT